MIDGLSAAQGATMSRPRRRPEAIAKNKSTSRHAGSARAKKTPAQWAAEDEDVRLMLTFQAGDPAAFTKLIERNQARVFGVIYHFLGDSTDAEDLAQEVFLRVYRTANRYIPAAKFTTWLYRIAANLSLNALRSRGKVKILPLELPDDDGHDGFRREVVDLTTGGPDDGLDSADLEQKIIEAVEKLPENQRIAVILSKYEHMSYEEVAKVMDCSVMAVKSLLSRGRANLRQSLARYLAS